MSSPKSYGSRRTVASRHCAAGQSCAAGRRYVTVTATRRLGALRSSCFGTVWYGKAGVKQHRHSTGIYAVLCRVYTRIHVGRIYVSQTSNLYPDTLYVDGYKLFVRVTCIDCISATIHLCHGRLVSLCIQQQTDDKLATILSPTQDTCRWLHGVNAA